MVPISDEQFTLVFKDIDPGKIGVNTKDAERLDIEVGDIVEFVDPDIDESAAAKVLIHKNIPEGHFVVSAELASSIGAEEGFEFNLRRYEGSLNTALEKVSIGIGDAGLIEGLDIEEIITTKQSEIEAYLSRRLLFNGLKMKWPELGITLEVASMEPELPEGEYAICQEVMVELYPIVKSAFNGILLIDSSRSMEERDVVVDSSVHTALTQLHKMAEGIPNVASFIAEVENRSVARRLESAVLSGMLYFAEKVARGKGEKIAVIPYSNNAEPIEFSLLGETQPWLDVSKGGLEEHKSDVSMLLGSHLLMKVTEMTSRHTNMGDAMDKAYDIAQKMGAYEQSEEGQARERPVMIVLLTDGEFDVGDSPVRVVRKRRKEVSKVVVHTVGIGDEIDEAVLKRIAQLGHGEYIHANDLNRLLEFYSSLAKKFKASYHLEDAGTEMESKIVEDFEKVFGEGDEEDAFAEEVVKSEAAKASKVVDKVEVSDGSGLMDEEAQEGIESMDGPAGMEAEGLEAEGLVEEMEPTEPEPAPKPKKGKKSRKEVPDNLKVEVTKKESKLDKAKKAQLSWKKLKEKAANKKPTKPTKKKGEKKAEPEPEPEVKPEPEPEVKPEPEIQPEPEVKPEPEPAPEGPAGLVEDDDLPIPTEVSPEELVECQPAPEDELSTQFREVYETALDDYNVKQLKAMSKKLDLTLGGSTKRVEILNIIIDEVISKQNAAMCGEDQGIDADPKTEEFGLLVIKKASPAKAGKGLAALIPQKK